MNNGQAEDILLRISKGESKALGRYRREHEGEEENELGLPALLVKRASFPRTPPERGRQWGAECRCGFCEMVFPAGRDPGSGALYIEESPLDCRLLPGIPPDARGAGVRRVEEGEVICCPFCEERLEIRAVGKIGAAGKCRRALVQTLERERAGGTDFTVLVVWLLQRETTRRRTEDSTAAIAAFILDENGRLHRYARIHRDAYGGICGVNGQWRKIESGQTVPRWSVNDSESFQGRKRGVLTARPTVATLAGATGEKTGLAEAMAAGLENVTEYLTAWKRQPFLENLVRAGWARAVAESLNGAGAQALSTIADLRRAKPSEQLGMTREEVRRFRGWSAAQAKSWKQYRDSGGAMAATEFAPYYRRIRVAVMLSLEREGIRAEKVLRYLAKQGATVDLLLDTWEMSRAAGLRLEDEQVRFPTRLRETHDRLSQIRKAEAAEELRAEYTTILREWGGLEWDDGELCIRLPRAPEELVREGSTLQHCVGRYTEKHARRTDVIFFVRRKRRPERSYYTLDICFTEGEPFEVQLHGFGNEGHGPGHSISHSIPRKVRAFCDRWEQEILLPQWQKGQEATA